jgi:putative nucleotidyltransferase with HDIG domain
MEQKHKNNEILAAVSRVPLLSVAAMRILELTAQADHTLAEVIALVKNDAAITAKLLKIVNSPVYGLLEPATSLDRAISYLGENMVVSIVLEDTLGNYLHAPLQGYGSSSGDLWKHDLRTAIAAREIALLNRDACPPDIAFTGGLLHDIGKSVLSGFLQDQYQSILTELATKQLPDYLAGERELLGMDHAEVGYELAKNWQLPELIRTVIRHHHTPALAPEDSRIVVYAVHLGDIVAMMGGYGTGTDNLFYRLDQRYIDYLPIGPEQMGTLMLTVDEKFNEAVEAMQG